MMPCVIIRRQIVVRAGRLLGVIIMTGLGMRAVAALLKGENVAAIVLALKTTHRLEGMHPSHREQGDEANEDACRTFHEHLK